jgi:hypothetical protein
MTKEKKPSMTAFVKGVVAEFISALSVLGVPTKISKKSKTLDSAERVGYNNM